MAAAFTAALSSVTTSRPQKIGKAYPERQCKSTGSKREDHETNTKKRTAVL
eukprot:jgi/Antlo1/69/1262